MIEAGLADREIAERLGVPRRTIAGWRLADDRLPLDLERAGPWRPDAGVRNLYAYVLGMYLGDGHVANPRVPFLRVSLDGAYPQVIGELRHALERVFAPRGTRRVDHAPSRAAIIQLSHPNLIEAFPQHGPGKKHERPIVLEDWQRAITHEHPESLLRGLIHSNGCRTLNRFRTTLPSGRVAEYAYPRYFFTNLSSDIRGIFCEHCDLLGIRWTQSNARNISVSHRPSVALLDELVGPKR